MPSRIKEELKPTALLATLIALTNKEYQVGEQFRPVCVTVDRFMELNGNFTLELALYIKDKQASLIVMNQTGKGKTTEVLVEEMCMMIIESLMQMAIIHLKEIGDKLDQMRIDRSNQLTAEANGFTTS